MNLDHFPRVSLCHRPTPLETLERLSRHLGGPRLLVKRDDCTGLAFGGNKTRKLEFLMGQALAEGATTVVTVGGVQSNHCRQTAAAAAKLGLKCELILPHLSRFTSTTYDDGGNVLVDRLLGARLHVTPDAASSAARAREVLAAVRAAGEVPFFIPAGGSTAVGALGYVDAACELAGQAAERKLTIDHIVVTTGSCTTHAGLLVGLEYLRDSAEFKLRPKVFGISVYQRAEGATTTVGQKVRETVELLASAGVTLDAAAIENRVSVTDDYLGDGYGEPTAAMVEAVGLAARTEGLLVDPVYTGKTLAGLIGMVRQGRFQQSDTVLFWHTGGTPALFPYGEAFDELLDQA